MECAASLRTGRQFPLDQLLQRLPMPVIAVDSSISATCANRAAEEILGSGGNLIRGRLVGDVIECVNTSQPGGCGRTVHCAGCAIRRMATATFRDGRPRCSVEADQSVRRAGAVVPTRYTLSTQKLGDVVLVMIENVDALSTDACFAEQSFEI